MCICGTHVHVWFRTFVVENFRNFVTCPYIINFFATCALFRDQKSRKLVSEAYTHFKKCLDQKYLELYCMCSLCVSGHYYRICALKYTLSSYMYMYSM